MQPYNFFNVDASEIDHQFSYISLITQLGIHDNSKSKILFENGLIVVISILECKIK